MKIARVLRFMRWVFAFSFFRCNNEDGKVEWGCGKDECKCINHIVRREIGSQERRRRKKTSRRNYTCSLWGWEVERRGEEEEEQLEEVAVERERARERRLQPRTARHRLSWEIGWRGRKELLLAAHTRNANQRPNFTNVTGRRVREYKWWKINLIQVDTCPFLYNTWKKAIHPIFLVSKSCGLINHDHDTKSE